MSFFCLQRDWKNVLLFAVALATEESEAVEDHVICKEQNAHSIYFILFLTSHHMIDIHFCLIPTRWLRLYLVMFRLYETRI